MSTAGDLISSGIGSGLGIATIWFPITFLAVRKQFSLRGGLGQAWRPYLSCVFVFALLNMLGVRPSSDTVLGIMEVLVFPPLACAAILHFTYRTLPSRPTE